jgi:parallel beta-helix repeat protein
MLTLFAISMLTFAFSIQSVKAEPTTIIVPDDYPTIQDAINAASLGDTIYVRTGTYHENVVVNETVSLIGENRSTTIVDGDGTESVITVTQDSINITGFTIENSGTNWTDSGIYLNHANYCNISNNNIRNNHDGINLEYSSNNVLTGNTASNNNRGIYLYYSSNNVLTGNTASNNQYNFGVGGNDFSHFNNLVDTSNTVDGKPIYYLISVADAVYDAETNAGTIYLIKSNNITVRDLTLTKNWYGVFFWNTTNSKIESVTASNNNRGIALYYSSNNVLTGNTASNNSWGIYLRLSSNNTLFHNNLIDNTFQADVTVGNMWDDGYPSGGNYWSDYTGTDADGDGIGDTPYIINTNNRDRYPLMSPWGEIPVEEEEEVVPFWMLWWFWAIVVVVIVALAGAVYFLKRRKQPTQTYRPQTICF